MKALVVSSIWFFRGAWKKDLEELGYEVHEASRGEAALEQLEHEKPDVILMEVAGLSSAPRQVNACREIHDRYSGVPIIIHFYLTDAMPWWQPYVVALLTGAVGYLPFDSEPRPEHIELIKDTTIPGWGFVDNAALEEAMDLWSQFRPLVVSTSMLTNHEERVLALIERGKTNCEVATELDLEPACVSEQISTIFNKLDLGIPWYPLCKPPYSQPMSRPGGHGT